jgi:3-hydroxyisobutyrate dehydrogenase-like beta-hydroxyacid dehydrogenase
MRVGFIGLGNQGAPIARRIARCGFELVACDINAQALSSFDEPGVKLEGDPLATAAQAECLCVCVRMDHDLIKLIGNGGVFRELGEGGVFIVHSTVEPRLCRDLSERAGRHGVAMLDAGVSGGGDAALNGQLSIFVGGERPAFERVRPLLESYGKSVALLGPVGRGMEAKLLNNLVSIANYGMSAAILELGERLHFDREQLRQALLAGSAEGFALRAIPGLVRADRAPWLHEILSKDLDHSKRLVPLDDPAMAALVHAAQSMLDRLARAKDASYSELPTR